MEHRKKILPESFEAIISGKKKFELRLDDFEIKEGDVLILEEQDSDDEELTGRTIAKKVTHVGKLKIDDTFWSEEEIKEKGLQIISFK